MKIRRQRKSKLEVDMSPLIDCVFQLLVFFMLSSTFMTPSMRVRLPGADANQMNDSTEIVVNLGSDGSLDVNGEPATLSNLESNVARQLESVEVKAVTIRGDQDIPYGVFVQAMAKIRRAGATQVNIAHENAQD